jgi:hypothetical protein
LIRHCQQGKKKTLDHGITPDKNQFAIESRSERIRLQFPNLPPRGSGFVVGNAAAVLAKDLTHIPAEQASASF